MDKTQKTFALVWVAGGAVLSVLLGPDRILVAFGLSLLSAVVVCMFQKE